MASILNWRDGFERGAFKVRSLPEVRKIVRLRKGRFDEFIVQYLKTIDDKTNNNSLLAH